MILLHHLTTERIGALEMFLVPIHPFDLDGEDLGLVHMQIHDIHQLTLESGAAHGPYGTAASDCPLPGLSNHRLYTHLPG